MRSIKIVSALLVAQLFVGLSSVMAETPEAATPWSKTCRHYHSGRHFVSESTPYCLRQSDQKACHQQAEKYFERCSFSGDFERMSARMSARMLLVLALSSVGSVHQLDL